MKDNEITPVASGDVTVALNSRANTGCSLLVRLYDVITRVVCIISWPLDFKFVWKISTIPHPI